MTENALSILIVIFSIQLQQTEKLFIFHLGRNERRRRIFDRVATDHLRDLDNAAGIGDNSAEIGDGAAGIVDITANVIPC